MTHEEFTGVIFDDLDSSGTRISKSSKFSGVNSTQIALNIPHTAHIMNRQTTDKIILYARNTKSDNNR